MFLYHLDVITAAQLKGWISEAIEDYAIPFVHKHVLEDKSQSNVWSQPFGTGESKNFDIRNHNPVLNIPITQTYKNFVHRSPMHLFSMGTGVAGLGYIGIRNDFGCSSGHDQHFHLTLRYHSAYLNVLEHKFGL